MQAKHQVSSSFLFKNPSFSWLSSVNDFSRRGRRRYVFPQKDRNDHFRLLLL
jgi:hypothetical protein